MLGRDHYETLLVDREASTAEIRAAYRRLVRRHQPDLNPGDAAALKRIKEINAAYEALCDPVSRAQYDRELAWQEQRSPGRGLHDQPEKPPDGHDPYGGYGYGPRRGRGTQARPGWIDDFFSDVGWGGPSGLDELFDAVERLKRSVEERDADVDRDIERIFRLMRRRFR